MTKIDYSKSKEWMSDEKYLHEFVDLVELKKDDTVLDVGCGNGYVLLKF